MEAYIYALLSSIIIAFTIKKLFGFHKHKTIKMFIALLPLTIVSAIRYNVGWDYSNYSVAFSNYIEYGKLYFDEVGFKALVQFLSFFTNDPTILFATFSILISFFFSKCFQCYGDEKNVLQYIILFVFSRFFFCSMNIIRQAFAMVLAFYALHYILYPIAKRGYLRFVVAILIAASFHKFALVFLPLAFIIKVDFRRLLGNIKILISSILVGVVLVVMAAASGYFSYFETMFGNDGTFALSELILSLVILVFGGVVYKKIRHSQQDIMFYNFEILAFAICLASPFIPTADRIVWYFSILPSIFLIPKVIALYDGKMSIIPATVIYVFLSIVVINQTILSDSYDIVPYESIVEVNNQKETL